jgi:gliding motility-associated-like protein
VFPILRHNVLTIALAFAAFGGKAQVVTECPQNIGFETGTFRNWECYTGQISGTGQNFPNAQRPAVINLSSGGQTFGQHTIIRRGSGFDAYGEFSLDSPNGSDHVVRLGNANNQRGAERISYIVNVPANVEAYSILFNYAVVLENPDHAYDEQPKFTAQVTDLSTGLSTECGSFEFIAPGAGGGIPGFLTSSVSESVLYKPWSPVMLNLSNYLGKSIRLDFTTNDCSRGRHFGYAYIDFNENCSTPIIGNVTCPETTSITLSTVTGLSQYRWFNAETNSALGSGERVTLTPVPPVGTRIGVEMTPYDGLGCTQTLYTTITGMYMNFGNPPPTCTTADLTATALTVGNSSDLTYTYWTDAAATSPLDNPRLVSTEGTYYVKGVSSSGCHIVRPTVVTKIRTAPIPITPPAPVDYPTSVDITRSFVPEPDMQYTYWTDPQAKSSLSDPVKIKRGGVYYIKKETRDGCSVINSVPVTINLPEFYAPNTFTPNGDGVNDEFVVVISNKAAIKSFKIFNRWGQIVYQTQDIDHYWKGLKDNSQLPTGVYYWVIDTEADLPELRKSGYVTLIR